MKHTLGEERTIRMVDNYSTVHYGFQTFDERPVGQGIFQHGNILYDSLNDFQAIFYSLLTKFWRYSFSFDWINGNLQWTLYWSFLTKLDICCIQISHSFGKRVICFILWTDNNVTVTCFSNIFLFTKEGILSFKYDKIHFTAVTAILKI